MDAYNVVTKGTFLYVTVFQGTEAG